MERLEREIEKLAEKYGEDEAERNRLRIDLHLFMTVIIREIRDIHEPEIIVSRRHG